MSGRSLLPNARLIAAREFRSRVGARSFLWGTVLLAALSFAATQAPVLLDAIVRSSDTRLAVVVVAPDLSADSASLLDRYLNGNSTGSDSGAGFTVSWLEADRRAKAMTDLEDGRLDAVLTIERDSATGNLVFELHTDMLSDGPTVRTMAGAATILAIDDVARRAGTSFGAVLATPVQIVPVHPESGPPSTISGELQTNLISTALIVLIFMAIITYGTWVAMSVAEEKGSRVMELMLNAATPIQMLAGKVVGNGGAGLLQYGLILSAVVVGLLAQEPIHRLLLGDNGSGLGFGGLSPAVFGAFIVLFGCGFVLYSLLYAALGSLVSRQEDVQSATSPLMMLTMTGYLLSVFGLQAIDEGWVKILSFVPFFSPYLMLGRVSVGHVEPWEFFLAVGISLASIVVALVVAARIYSAGVLLYGQRVGVRQVLRAARVAR
jgi:ABC-2 type transport system permease protein